MLAILKDAESRPDLFTWFGAIARGQIEVWLRSSNLEVPDDLLDFWTKTGGGDLFECETMFRPTQIPSLEPYFVSGDDIDTANQYRIPKGMSVLPGFSRRHFALCGVPGRQEACDAG
jgi:hypothetical protein